MALSAQRHERTDVNRQSKPCGCLTTVFSCDAAALARLSPRRPGCASMSLAAMAEVLVETVDQARQRLDFAPRGEPTMLIRGQRSLRPRSRQAGSRLSHSHLLNVNRAGKN